MRTLLLVILAGLVAFGAEDEWAKVKALKTGAEIRVYKKGSAQPIQAQLGDLTDDNLIILVKKTESAIPRDQIDRIDARPSGSRVTKESTTKETTQAGHAAPEQPGSSSGGSVSFGSKPDFETVYRRPVGAPKK